MKAMILAAGMGTRLRPLTNLVPKPMVQLAGRPCMEHTIRLLRKHNISETVVNLHYKPQLIKKYFGSGSQFGVKMQYSKEDTLMGTAGGFKKVQQFFNSDTALIISGDGLTDIDIRDFYNFHKEKGCIATLALKRVGNPQNYGVVKLNADSTIEMFQEKPEAKEAVSNLANTGIYIFEPEIFDYIPANSFYDFGKQLFPEFVQKGIEMAGYLMEGYWCDIGDLDIYRDAHYDVLMDRVNIEVPGRMFPGNIWLGSNTVIHPETRIIGPVIIGDNCGIEKGVQIYGPSVLGENNAIKENAVIKRSILWDNVCVDRGAFVMDSIAGTQSQVKKDEYLEKAVVEGQEVPTYKFA